MRVYKLKLIIQKYDKRTRIHKTKIKDSAILSKYDRNWNVY